MFVQIARAASRTLCPEARARRAPTCAAGIRSVLYAVLQAELEIFLAQAQLEHDRVPAFVERELRDFLRCGILAHGFVRVHCDGCGHDRLVAFSCKGRGFCPSCGGKRMTRFAAHAIDRVLPVAPVRQWVLTVLAAPRRARRLRFHASVAIPARARDRLERLLRYCARPAISHPRLTLASDGRVLLALKTPRFDGTTHLVLSPHELIERLVALVPRPNKNLILYGGVLAPNAKWRTRVTQYGRHAVAKAAAPGCTHQDPGRAADPPDRSATAESRPAYNSEWSRLMRRAFDLDVLKCPSCSGRMRVLALIESPQIARRILRHLGLRDHAPPIAPAHSLPDPFDDVA
jgi:hypothetical protein